MPLRKRAQVQELLSGKGKTLNRTPFVRVRLCLGVFVCVLVLSSVPLHAASSLSVLDFGAKGDGKADDTAAIRKAIEAGRTQSRPVTFPRGQYIVTQPLEIEGQSLEGAVAGAWNADSCPMPTLRVSHAKGPAITMKEGASLHALALVYDRKDGAKYPAAIQVSGCGVSITNTRLQYCDDGIMADGKSNTGRLNIENVFIVAPRGVGVYVTRTYDVPTLRNIEVWNNASEMFPGPAFRFGHNDGMRASQLFAFKLQVGFEFVDDETGAFWGILQDCATDACSVGVRVNGEKAHTIGITGGFFWDHHMTLDLLNPKANVRVANAELQSNGAPAIDCKACGSLLVNNCRLTRAMENKEIWSANLESAGSASITNCRFEAFGPCISIGKGVKQGVISGNVFAPSSHERIRDNRGDGSDIVISGNSGG